MNTDNMIIYFSGWFQLLKKQLLISQETACTSRFEITDVLVHGTDEPTVSNSDLLHGAARTGKPPQLHGTARTGKNYCITPPSCAVDQTTHLTRECMDWKPYCSARSCTECLVATIARHCTEPMQQHCQFHVGARHCRQFPDI